MGNERATAASTYAQILENVPGDREALDSLCAIYASQGEWRRYVAACERFLPHAASPKEQSELLKALGAILEKQDRQLLRADPRTPIARVRWRAIPPSSRPPHRGVQNTGGRADGGRGQPVRDGRRSMATLLPRKEPP